MALRLEAVVRARADGSLTPPVDLVLEPGQLVVLLGRTGAGKSGLLRVCAGLDRPRQGRVLLGGLDLFSIPLAQRRIGFVGQEFVNYPGLTVFENIGCALRNGGAEESELRRRVQETADALGLTEFLERKPGELSGGQQQRTALARALAKDADLILLDEPLVNLDFKLRESLRLQLRELFAARRQILLYATTDPQEALLLQSEVAVMDAGGVLQRGRGPDVLRWPARVEVAELTSDPPMNLLDFVVLESGRLGAAGIEISWRGQRPAGSSIKVGFRPSDARLGEASEASIELQGILELADLSGSETFLHLALPSNRSVIVRQSGLHRHPPGERIPFSVPTDRLHFFGSDGARITEHDPTRTGAKG